VYENLLVCHRFLLTFKPFFVFYQYEHCNEQQRYAFHEGRKGWDLTCERLL